MPATYTFDIVSTLDGFASFEGGDWGPFWGKGGPELLEHRLAAYREEQRLVLGANTYRQFVQLLGPSTEASKLDPLKGRNEDHAADGGVEHGGGPPRLAGLDRRKR